MLKLSLWLGALLFAPLHFQGAFLYSKSGEANAKWNVQSGAQKYDKMSRMRQMKADYQAMPDYVMSSAAMHKASARAHLGEAKARAMSAVDGIKEAANKQEEVKVVRECGEKWLGAITGELPDAGMLNERLAPKTESIKLSNAQSALIVIQPNPTGASEGIVESLTFDFACPTQGMVFTLDEPAACGQTAGDNIYPDGISVPADAASFIAQKTGPQTVKLSHPIIVNTGKPLVIVVDLNSACASTFPAPPSVRTHQVAAPPAPTFDCPLKVLSDNSVQTSGMRTQMYNHYLRKSTRDSMIAEVMAADWSSVSNRYEVFRDRYTEPHALAGYLKMVVGSFIPHKIIERAQNDFMVSESGQYELIMDPLNLLSYEYDLKFGRWAGEEEQGAAESG